LPRDSKEHSWLRNANGLALSDSAAWVGRWRRPFSRNHFPVWAFDMVAAQIGVLVERGADRASDLPSLIAAADVIITMLPDTPDVANVVSGPGGLVETGRAGMLMIDMSTIDPVPVWQGNPDLIHKAFLCDYSAARLIWPRFPRLTHRAICCL
jgi:hypothetical protein